MTHRLLLPVLLAFWAVMNWLLWQTELRSDKRNGTAIPAAAVWQKVLTAPDSSSLEIFHRGKRVGTCRWVANVGEERATGQAITEEPPPEGMVPQLTGYTVDFDGNVMFPDLGNNARFYIRFSLTTNQVWKELSARFHFRPFQFQLQADAAAQRLKYRLEGEDAPVEQTLTFAELRNPHRLLRELGGPLAAGLLDGLLPTQAGTNALNAASLGLDWEAHKDSMLFGRTPMRVYRLRLRVLDQYEAVVYVSHAGEILKVSLPGEITMLNYALTTF